MGSGEASLGKYLVRFAAYYVGLGALLAAFSVLWPEITNYAALPALMAAASGASINFVQDHKRAFADGERRTMTRASFVLAWSLSIVSSLALILAQVGFDDTKSLLALARTTLETPPNGLIAAGALLFLSLVMYFALDVCYGRLARKFAENVSKL